MSNGRNGMCQVKPPLSITPTGVSALFSIFGLLLTTYSEKIIAIAVDSLAFRLF